MNKTSTPKGQPYESEAYTRGWLAGYDSLVVELYEGFNENLPKWLLAAVGGKKTVASALKSMKASKVDEIIFEPDYEDGETDGYEELLGDVEEAFKEQKVELPAFLQSILHPAQ